MVRLVFRPYTQVRRTICTSVSLRASTRVSPGFTLPRHSSPSFGSQRTRSTSNRSQRNSRAMLPQSRRIDSHLEMIRSNLYFHYAFRFLHPTTRVHVRLLGPCFKTGELRLSMVRIARSSISVDSAHLVVIEDHESKFDQSLPPASRYLPTKIHSDTNSRIHTDTQQFQRHTTTLFSTEAPISH